MQQVILIFLGGGLGSLCRHAMNRLLINHSSHFPFSTFTANVLSCLVLGIVVGLSIKNAIGNDIRLMLITGFCGGFSTFSTFSNETLQLLQNGAYLTALSYIFFSLLVCLICIYLGIRLVG